MTSDFLKCTICPKKPSFSDVSHLLTHVGSKGHLAHLHGLQVRSHQERAAAQTLTAYNQWYGDHGIPALLSDRMQQKEQKQADKRAATRRRQAASSSECNKTKGRGSTSMQPDPPATLVYLAGEQVSSMEIESDQVEEMHRSTDRAASQYPLIPSSPPKNHTAHTDDDDEFVDVDFEAPAKGSPGSPKLKGTHWPGMALFDAAPEDLKRKRNQKKDGSVLQKLERYAALVQPTETVHSAGGTVLKHRHLDNLEDDSPVEGEESVHEPIPKKRKTGGARSRRQTSDLTTLPSEKPRRRRLRTPIKRPESPVSKKSRIDLPSSPAEELAGDFKLTFRKIDRQKKKKTTFTIFEDSSPSLRVDGSYEDVPSAYVDTSSVQPQIAFRPMPVFRDSAELFDPFKILRDQLPPTMSGLTNLGQGKENYPEPHNGVNLDHHTKATSNPLFFHGDMRQIVDAGYDNENQFNLPTALHANPFRAANTLLPTRNPLMVSMQELNQRRDIQEEFGFDSAPSQNPRKLFMPRI